LGCGGFPVNLVNWQMILWALKFGIR
jgi:hypothetical protein